MKKRPRGQRFADGAGYMAFEWRGPWNQPSAMGTLTVLPYGRRGLRLFTEWQALAGKFGKTSLGQIALTAAEARRFIRECKRIRESDWS